MPGARDASLSHAALRAAGRDAADQRYSHAVAFTGRMVIVSGQVPLDAQGRLVGQDDPAAQITQVFENCAPRWPPPGRR